MEVIRETIQLPVQPHTMGWRENQLVCYENGERYYPEYDAYPLWREIPKELDMALVLNMISGFDFSQRPIHFALHKLSAKDSLFLENQTNYLGKWMDDYYCADVYEYPAAFYETAGRTYLIHCPLKYCRLDFEDIRNRRDYHHACRTKSARFLVAKLEISPGGHFLISKGWVWHPLDGSAYNIQDCFKNPLLLDVTINIGTWS